MSKASGGYNNIRLPQDHMSLIEGGGYIDETLIRRAPEQKIWIVKRLDEGAVDQYIDMLQQFALVVIDQAFKGEPREAPDVLLRLLMDGTGQFGKACRLIHGITTGESDIGKGVGNNDLHQLGGGHLPTPVEIPRLGVVTALAPMATTGTIDGGPESRTIHHCILDHV